MMKYILQIIVIVLAGLISCSNPGVNYLPAENGLDAGRLFLEACKSGDFNQAEFYLLKDEQNILHLKKAESLFREKDKEGRQVIKSSSINIKSVTDINDSTVVMEYSYSSDTMPKQLLIKQHHNKWQVDYKKTFQ